MILLTLTCTSIIQSVLPVCARELAEPASGVTMGRSARDTKIGPTGCGWLVVVPLTAYRSSPVCGGGAHLCSTATCTATMPRVASPTRHVPTIDLSA